MAEIKRVKKITRKARKKKSKRRTKNKFKKSKCAPRLKKDRLDFTCYTKKGLHKIKNIWNIKHPDRKILSNEPYNIWKSLQYAMSKTCNKESCWLRHKCIKEDIDLSLKKNTFAPKAPKEWKKNPTEWLTSVDILEVMNQYEKTYKTFEFLGPSPIDYDEHLAYGECVWEELCEFSLKDTIRNNKTKIGIIFNLDKHNKPGSHWVAMFINTKKREIYYLDSYGEKIPKRINKFKKKVQKQSLNVGNKVEYKYFENKKRHQFSNSECGMYCLYFIKHMLHTGDFKQYQ